MTFNTFYSNIHVCAKFRDLKLLTFLFLDLELVLISTGSIIKLESFQKYADLAIKFYTSYGSYELLYKFTHHCFFF